MSHCEIVTTTDGTKVLVNFAGPRLTVEDMAELNEFARQRRAKFEKKKTKSEEHPHGN